MTSPSGGHDPESEPQPPMTILEAPTRETSSSDVNSVAVHPGIRDAGDHPSSSSPKPGIAAGPDRARRKNDASGVRISERIVEIRRDLFGEEGTPAIAEALQLPLQTWMNYEKGVIMSAPVMLYFLDLTSVEPHWLLTGRGPRYRGPKVWDDATRHG